MEHLTGHRARADSDPLLTALHAQQASESQGEREERLRREAAAKKISDAIDEQLKAEEKARGKKRTEVKILLLGALNTPRYRLRYRSQYSNTCPQLTQFPANRSVPLKFC